MQQYHLILASASPRRQQLLTQIGIRFHVEVQDIDERVQPKELPHDYVLRMAEEKSASGLSNLSAVQKGKGYLVLAADTSVICDSEILGKPVDQSDAVRMLLQLSGREHQVISAVTLASENRQRSVLSESTVRFREISASEAEGYYLSGEPEGKAGGYAIQGYGVVFVEQLIGSYSAVMGLPLFETAQLFNEFGVQSQIVSVQKQRLGREVRGMNWYSE